ncbi:Kef-type K+ transport system, predicted NAD-binding component [Pseudoalteromonas luteoviolacea B = ATCC 29581]|nr:Kef-type K+ transport system, predicted NAD-binding component [Pseudoalteromonas luteoviolacea B = ATCC 29581]
MGSGFCFWHDNKFDKSGLELTHKLERYAKRGGLLQGLELKRANLEGLNLINIDSNEGYDLSYSNFYRANLRGAHLFNNTIRHASLMKADLREANLHCSDLRETNLLGIKLDSTRIDNIELGDALLQEGQGKLAKSQGNDEEALDLYQQSEEIYRILRKGAEQQGLFEMAGNYLYRELQMRHERYPIWSKKWFFSSFSDFFCGYGEKPENVIRFSLGMIFLCAIGYFFLGVNFQDQIIAFNFNNSWQQNLSALLNSFYFSVVTFTTLGYGDITPVGISRLIAAVEAFTGSFTLALFVVVFVKRMTR